MKSYRFRFFRFGRRPRTTQVRSTSVLFKRFSSFEGLELRSMLSGGSLLGDSALVGSAHDDAHESPVERICISSLMSSNLSQGGTADPLAATADEPTAEPLVTGVTGNVTVVLEDLSGNVITELQAGQDFRLRVFIDDLRTGENARGFAGAYVRLNYNSSLISLVDPASLVVQAYYDDYEKMDGTVSEAHSTPGVITAGGTSLNADLNALPGGDPKLLYSVTLRAVASGTAQFTTSFYEATDRDWIMYGTDGTIVDDDNITFNNASLNIKAQPTLSVGDVSATEGDSGTQNFNFVITLSEASATPVTVVYSTQAGTATDIEGSAQDFVPKSGTVTFEPGTTTKTIAVVVNGDTASEGDETFTFNLSSPTGATLADGTAEGKIIDNDNPLITIGSQSQNEGDTAGTMVFTVTLSKPSSGNVTVVYNTADGTALAGSDYTATSGTLTFTSGGSLTQTITVAVLGDEVREDNESFELNLSSPVGASFGEGDGEALGTLLNDDGPVLSILPGSVSHEEGDVDSTVVLTISLSEASDEDVVVAWNTVDGTATAGSDYVAASGTVTFEAGELTKLITLTVKGDNVDEADETFSVKLTPTNVSIAADTSVITILDDEGPTITVTGPAGGVNENAGSYVLTVTLSSPSNQAVTANWATADGTATAGSDYTSATGTVSFAPGETTKTITISLIGDTTREPNETFNVNFTNAVNGELASEQFVGTILNDDDLPQVEIIAPGGVNEGNAGGTPLVFTINLSSASSDPVTVVYNTVNGTATAGSDYTAASGTITFAPGVTTTTITVLATGDAQFETDETFRVDLSAPGGATLKSGASSATGRIVNDDPRPSISIGDPAPIAEGDSGTKQFLFTVTLSNSSTETVTVQYATQNGTATAGSDYTATSGTVTFNPGETTRVITVSVIGDKYNEEDETFTVQISNPTNGTINDAAAIGTILDEASDDVTISPSQINGRVTSGSSNKNLGGIEVRLTGAATMTTTTNSQGLYSFAGLMPGVYKVEFILPTQYKDGTVTLSNEDGEIVALAEKGFTITINDPGGVVADDYDFKTPGLKPQYYSARMLMASTIASDSEGVGQVSVSISTVTTPVSAAEAANTTITGTGTIGATVSVVASSGGQSTAAKTTTIAADGTWSITGIDVSALPDGQVRYDVTATADGTTDTSFIVTVKDTVAPTVDIVTVTNPINASNEDDTTISGTGTPGATITVTATDGATTTSSKTTTVDSAGTWSVSGIDVSALNDGVITYKVEIKDFSGNATVDTITSTKNAGAPALDIVTFPATVGPNNQGSFTISGTAKADSTITLNITDSASGSITQRTAEVDGSGNWSVAGIDVTSLAAGTLTVTVVVTDEDDNTSTDTVVITKDMATQVAISGVTDPINEDNVDAVAINGTGEANSTIVVTVSDGTNTVTANGTVDGSGNWSVTGIDVSTLDDGTLTFTVKITDGVGNTAEADIDAEKDTEDLDLLIDQINDTITQQNRAEFTITGSVMIGSTVTVVARSGETVLEPVTATVDENGDWTVDLNLTTLPDGVVTFEVTATLGEDDAEKTATAAKDTVAEGEFTEATTPVNSSNVTTAFANGGVEEDAEVTIIVTDSAGNSIDAVEVPAALGIWAIAGLDLTELVDGAITYQITVTDGLGNVSTYEFEGVKDTVAPELTVNAVEGPIGVADADSVSLSGTGNDPGATIKIVVSNGDDDLAEYAATVDASGNWTAENVDVRGLADGTLTFTVTSTDAAGNVTTNSERTAVKKTVSVLDFEAPITQANQDEVEVSGTADPDATVSVVARSGAQLLASQEAQMDENGNWTVTIDVSTLADGTITFEVTATAGGKFVVISTTAEKDTLAEGAIANGTNPVNAANAAAAAVNGTVEVGSDATLTITSSGGGTPIVIELVVLEDGTWSVTALDLTTLADGTLTYNLAVTDEHGNVTEHEIEAVKDTVAPELAINTIAPIGLGDVAGLAISGTGTPNAAIKVIVSDGVNSSAEYTATADGTGAWTVTGIVVSSLKDGTLTFTVTSRDAAGNETEEEATAEKQTVQIVLWPNSIGQGNEATVAIGGTSQPGSTVAVTISDGTNVVTAEVNVEVDGSWNTTVDLSGLEDGELTITATATDGDDSATDSATSDKDTVAEGSIGAATIAVNGSNQTAAAASGTAEAGSTVQLRVIGGEEGSEVIVGPLDAAVADGAWSLTDIDLTTLPSGPIRYEVTVTDSLGNVSVYTLAGVKDLVPPAVEMNALAGPINAAGADAVSVSGTAEVGATVVVQAKSGDSTVFSDPIVVDGTGTWTLTIDVSTLADGILTVNAKATDTAGNFTETDTDDVTKDTVAPAVTINNSVFLTAVKSSNETAVSIFGSREAQASIHITVTDGITTLQTDVAAGAGGYSTQMDLSSLNDGNLTLTVVATDAAGNTGTQTMLIAKDTVTTVAITTATDPVTSENAASVSISGTGEKNAEIRVTVTDGELSTVAYAITVAADGTWSIEGIDVSALADSEITFNVTATDEYGNTATASIAVDKEPAAIPLTSLAGESADDGIFGEDEDWLFDVE